MAENVNTNLTISSEPKERTKVFTFPHLDQEIHKGSLKIKVLDEIKASYSSKTWTCSPILALYLWVNQSELKGKHILELGAGTGLPGLVAANCGAFVTLSESLLLPKNISNLKRTCQWNNLTDKVAVVGITWGLFTGRLCNLKPVDLVIASDCFYDPIVFEPLVVTVAYILNNNPNSVFITAYQERSADWSLQHLLNKYNLTSSRIDIDHLGSDLGFDIEEMMERHTIHLFKIVRKSE